MNNSGEIFFEVEPRGSASFRAASASVTAFLPAEDVQGIRVYIPENYYFFLINLLCVLVFAGIEVL